MLGSWKEKEQTAHTKHTTCCWSNLIDCKKFSPKHYKIYVKHRAMLACNLLFAETSLCDVAHQVLHTLASSFWANPPFFPCIINCLYDCRVEQPAEAGSCCTPAQESWALCHVQAKVREGRSKAQAELSLHGL